MAGIVPAFVRRTGAVRLSSLVSSVELIVIVSSVCSPSPVRRSCGCLETSWHSRAFCVAIADSRGRITPRWSRRAHRLVRSCHRGARLSANVGRTGKEEPLIFRSERANASGLLRASRLFETGGCSLRANWPSRAAARRSAVFESKHVPSWRPHPSSFCRAQLCRSPGECRALGPRSSFPDSRSGRRVAPFGG